MTTPTEPPPRRSFLGTHIPYVHALFLVGALQGVDYLLRPESYAAPMVETWIPWRVWGVVMVTAGLVALVALRWPRAVPLVNHAHIFLAGVYTALAVGFIVATVARGQWWGWGMAPVFLLVAAGHAVPVILHASQSVADADD